MQRQAHKPKLAAATLLAGLAVITLACASDDDGSGSSLQGIPTSESAPGSDNVRRGELPAPTANGEANDRDDFINTTLAQLEQIETQLTEIEAQVETMGEDGTADARTRIDAVKTTVAETQSDLVEVPM